MRRARGWMAAASIASVVALASVSSKAAGPTARRDAHHGDALVRVQAWPDELEGLGLDVWTHHPTGPEILVRVTDRQRAQLDATGLPYTIVEPDLGPRIEAEAARIAAAPRPAHGGGVLDPTFYDDYRSLEDVRDRMSDLALAHPERVGVLKIGPTVEQRSIAALRLTNGGPDDRPVIVVIATQHAREWIALAATLWATEQIATARVGSPIDALLDQAELVIVPVANPDGYVHTWEEDRLWRKNRSEGVGVDLNRNWSVAWGGLGSSPYPLDENYRGAAPFSEPETAALRDFISADPDIVAVLDVHSYSQLVLYPWGFDTVDAPDGDQLGTLAEDVTDAMTQPYGTTYQALQSAAFYPAAGNAMDWSYGQRGLHALALELRPGPDEEPRFLLEPEHIVPTGQEVLAAITTLVESTLALGPGEPGDSGGPVDDPVEDETGAGEGPGDTLGEPPQGDEGTTGLPGGTAGSSETGGASPARDPGVDGGCGCRAPLHPAGSAAWMLLVVGIRRRGRGRRHAETDRGDASVPCPR